MATGGAPPAQDRSKIRIQGNRRADQGAPPAARARPPSLMPPRRRSSCNSSSRPSPLSRLPVASILAASSYPAEITEANSWLASRRNLQPQELAAEADKQSWDPSVKALLPFPPVLQNMASNLSWTSELGDAYYNQQAEVMDAIQVMRRQARRRARSRATARSK